MKILITDIPCRSVVVDFIQIIINELTTWNRKNFDINFDLNSISVVF